MALLLELLALLGLMGVVRVLFLAARARPEDPGIARVARIALAASVVFALWTLIDLDYVRENAGSIANTLIGIVVVGAIILAYRALLLRIRSRADGS